MNFDQDDVHNLALVAWKEARGDGVLACEAVMHVCVNRVGAEGFAKTLHDVIYGKNQFTSMSVPSDPEFNLEPEDNDLIMPVLLQQAPNVLGEIAGDPTGGALWYANLAHIDEGGWFERNIVKHPERWEVTARIGHHTFYGPPTPADLSMQGDV